MKTALCGRIALGASAVFFGVIALLWRDPETWQNVYRIRALPFGPLIGTCLMAALIAGGIGILHPRSARPASVILGIVFLCFSLACVPDTLAASNIYEKYGGSFFLFLSLFFAAMALYAATEANTARAARFGLVARLGLGVCAISFMLGQAVIFRLTVHTVPKWIPPGQMFWAVFTTAAFAIAAVAILANRHARLAMRMMALMVGLFGVLVWVPHLIAHPESHFNWSECAETSLVMAASWTVADHSP